jgi:eukaryotic-like serine/threonine-protein kinase
VAKASCLVPALVGKTLPRARKLLVARHCRLGLVAKTYSSSTLKGRVLKQRPKPGKRMARNARVDVVLGRGPRR